MLLARYNLKVGSIYDRAAQFQGEYTSNDAGYGKQSSEVLGYVFVDGQLAKGTVPFSVSPNNNYWVGKIGSTYSGRYCTNSDWSNCAFVYDNQSNLYQYVNNYKNYLEGLGITIKEARIPKLEESRILQRSDRSKWSEVSHWIGTAISDEKIFNVCKGCTYFSGEPYSKKSTYGIRPLIII